MTAEISSLALDYLGCAIAVTAAPAHLAWLREFLSPPFAAAPPAAAQHTVRYTTDPTRYKAVLARGPAPGSRKLACFAFDQREVVYPVWGCVGTETVVFDAEFRSFYVIGGDVADVEVVAHQDDHWPRIGLMRVVREIAAAHAEAAGALTLHGAAVKFGDGAAILVGPKRSGKTSLMFHALLRPGTALVANDRVMLEGPDWRVTGMPTVINVRRGTRALFASAFAPVRDDPARASLSAAERAMRTATSAARPDSALVLNPAQLCEIANAERAGTTPLKAIVFPHVDPDGKGLALKRLDPAAAQAQLPSALFQPASRLCISRGRDPTLPAIADAAGVLEAAARSIPCFECVLGEDAYAGDSRTDFFSQLLRASE
jgi:hypothetical protein